MNYLIRNEAKKSGVKLWQIADKLGCTDSTFSRKLSKEFSADETKKILSIINQIKEDKQNDKLQTVPDDKRGL